MKKLLLFLLLITSFAYGQQTNSTNTSFTNGLGATKFFNIPSGAAFPTTGILTGSLFYKTSSTVGYYYYDGSTWQLLSISGSGVTSFNSRTGAVVPLTGDYSAFYPLLNGTGATGTWGVSITGNAATTTSLAGGLGGQIPYQSSAGVTAFLANGSAGQVLKSNGTTLAPSWTTDGGGTVTSITPGYGHTSNTPITGSGTITIDTTSLMATKAYVNNFVPQTRTVAGFSLNSNVTLADLSAGYGTSFTAYNGSTARTVIADTSSATGLVSKGRLASFTYTKAQADARFAPISVVGSVTSVSVVTANGVSGSVATATTTPAITLTLGNITPSSVVAGGIIYGTGSLSGYVGRFINNASTGMGIQVQGGGTTSSDTSMVVNNYLGTNLFTVKGNGSLTSSGTALTLGSTAINLGSTTTTLAGLASVTSTTFVGALTGNATSATTVAVTNNTTTNDNYYPTYVTANSGNQAVTVASTKLTFNPSTATLTTTTFSGALSGNATTATALATGRTIGTLTGDGTSAGSSFDGTQNNTNALTLATVNTTTGSYGSATKASTFTVNGKGLVTVSGETTITPAVGSITGLGTGVATALAVNIGTSGAVVTNGGALGTPSSGTITNLTGTCTSCNIIGNATNATNVSITDDNSTNATMYPTWVTSNSSNLPMKVSSTGVTWNPSTKTLSIGNGSYTGVPTPTLLGAANDFSSSGTNLVGVFKGNQSVATTSIQGVEGYVKSTHTTGTVALMIGVVGNADVSGSSAVTTVHAVRAGGIFPGSNTITDWDNFASIGATLSGGGTITNYYGMFLSGPTLTSGTVTNRYGIYSGDGSANNYFAGTGTFIGQVNMGQYDGGANYPAQTGYELSVGENGTSGKSIITAGSVSIAGHVTTEGVTSTGATGTGKFVFDTSPTISNPVITNIAPAANFTLTQNSVVPFTSVNSGAVVNTLYLKTGKVAIGAANPDAFTSYSLLTVGALATTNNGITIASTTTGAGNIEFADGTTGSQAYEGYIAYGHTANQMSFGTNHNDQMYISSAGVVTIVNLGSGAVQSTAGVLSVVSDSQVKDVGVSYSGSALAGIMKIPSPKYWNYNSKSGLPSQTYTVNQFGLLADSVHAALGEVFAPTQMQTITDKATNTSTTSVIMVNGKPTYGLSDRAILSLSIQAEQELNNKVDALPKAVSMSTINATTTVLTKALLNTTYPNVPVGYQVICGNITAGAVTYIKYSENGTTDVWLTITNPKTN